MMSVNNALNHIPPSTWTCYTANGAEAAGHSNLFLGVNSVSAISGYIQDPGSGNSFVGHRRWILYPQTQVMGTGDIPSVGSYFKANALWVMDSNIWGPRPTTREEFVAWPPKGYVPYQVVFARWSFSYANADLSSATVSMTSGGNNIAVALSQVQNGYGENTLVWIPMNLNDSANWPKPSNDTTYTVTVANVVINGASRTFTYDVTVFDPSVSSPTPTPTPTPSASNGIAYKGDFNGDGVSDILWQNSSSGLVAVWFMANGKYSSATTYGVAPSGWTITAIADFNGDGRADILWQHSSGALAMWITSSDGMSVTASVVTFNGAPVSLGNNSDWRLLGTGKFGATTASVLWQNTRTGDVAVWQMSGATIASGAWVVRSLPLTWQFKGISDFNGDGTDDILWQDPNTGQIAMWIMNGPNIGSGSIVGLPPSGWAYRGAAAFDGGAKVQILWQNTTSGQLAIWTMNGATITWTGTPGGLDSSWVFKGLGKFNSDAKVDILWQNTNGEVVTWLMNATSVSGSVSSGVMSSDWVIQ
ncbi:MAG: VCBS repeat-containing protein [Nitrospirae bacterium]|nr:VCBS repeat-containing protein [Nitrospirota bacterium]